MDPGEASAVRHENIDLPEPIESRLNNSVGLAPDAEIRSGS
jgi:hypothetical protein